MSSPLHKREAPQWNTFWRRFCPVLQTRGGHSGAVPPNFFCVPPNFVMLRKICFKYMLNDKKKNVSHYKCIFPPKALNLAMGLVLPKWCLQLGYFVSKAIRPRDLA